MVAAFGWKEGGTSGLSMKMWGIAIFSSRIMKSFGCDRSTESAN